MEKILLYTIASLAAYLFGSIPWALVIGKVFYKVDIREHGSGNLGGTNAGRVLGAKAGAAVMFLDISKSFIIVAILSFIDPTLATLCGMFTSIGHSFPIFANFKGGKAVSTIAGYLIAMTFFVTHNPLIQLLIPLIVFLTVLFVGKMVSLASMVAMASAAIVSYFQPYPLFSITMTILAVFGIYRHRENIGRILKGEERKVGFLTRGNSL